MSLPRNLQRTIGRGLLYLVLSLLALIFLFPFYWLLLSAFGWTGTGSYLLAWSCTLGKTAVMGALSLLLSLALTSEAAAMAFAMFFWILGHFSAELHFIAERSGNALLRAAILAFSHAAPDFAHLDYRDAFGASLPGLGWMAAAAVYVIAYCAVCLALSVQVFEQKEF